MRITLNNGEIIQAYKVYFNSNSIDAYHNGVKRTIDFDCIDSIESV